MQVPESPGDETLLIGLFIKKNSTPRRHGAKKTRIEDTGVLNPE
jgi:hypothetical protein